MNTCKKLLTALFIAALCSVLPYGAFAMENNDDLNDEIERQVNELDLEPWDEYTDSLRMFSDFGSFDEFLISAAEKGSVLSSSDLFEILGKLIAEGFKGSLSAICLLTASALLTALSGIVADEGISRALGTVLCLTAVASVAGMLSSLAATAYSAVRETARLTEKTAPVMSALMVSLGSKTTAGVFTPEFVFLSGSVVSIIEKAALPLSAAHGVAAAAQAVSDEAKLGGILKLLKKVVKWILGVISTVYIGLTAVHGLTAASRDGVMIRTAKYALDKLVPIAGGMVGGAADSILGCALLIRNGVGTAAVLILLARTAGPLTVLFLGMLVFRIAEALSAPLADERAVRLLSNAADAASDMFACTVVAGVLYALTVLIIMASGGIAAGLW